MFYGYNHFGIGWFQVKYENFTKHKTNLTLYMTREGFFPDSEGLSFVIKLKYSKTKFLITK